MPRRSREFSSTQIYHVMIRGNERKRLFLDDQDYWKLVKILRAVKDELEYKMYAFCIMNNHAHLLINDYNNQLPQIMKGINTSYALYFNKKYDRVGHVFQGRYKSQAIEDDTYLLVAVRYIHNNPVKARLVNEPAQYKWSSYSAYIHDNECFGDLIDVDMILSLFSTGRESALQAFIDFSMLDSLDILMEPWKEENAMIPPGQETMFVKDYLMQNKLEIDILNKQEHKAIRNQLIQTLKAHSILSIREIADILQINRNTIQRIK